MLTFVKKTRRGRAMYHCSCGNEKELWMGNVDSGGTKSCGCIGSGRRSKWPNVIRGFTNHPMYATWSNIKQRCCNPECDKYKYYGARGIQMFTEWQTNPQVFLDYVDALPRPDITAWTIDRIENDGHYEPGNLRWADMRTQNRNRRKYESRERH